jgi:hypothetical protein
MSKKTSFDEAIDSVLNALSTSTGKDESEILDFWFPIFQARDLYVKKCKEATNLNEIDLLLNRLEKDITFEILWIQHALDAVQTWKRVNSSVKKAESRLSEIKFLKQMNRLNDVFEKNNVGLDFSQKQVKKELRKTDPYSNALTALDYVNGSRVKKTIWSIRASVFKYKFYRWSRNFLRIGLKVFWGLIVFTLGVGLIINLIPVWYLSLVVIPAGLWFLQEFYFDPWLERKLLIIQRVHLRSAIHKLFVAQWQAYSYLLLESYDLPDEINPLSEIREKVKSE